jgi:hypothetical protein
MRTQLTIIRGDAQLAQRQLDAPSPDDQMAMRRALVAIEQASRALEAWIEWGLRSPR